MFNMWKEIEEAYKLVEKGSTKKVVAFNFKIYQCGDVIRIDIKQEK